MRVIWMGLMLVGCTDLPEMPKVSQGVEWDCSDEFEEVWTECAESGCNGVLSMDSLVDSSPMQFTSDRVSSELDYSEDGALQAIHFYAITEYFRGVVRIESIDMQPEQDSASFAVRQDDSEAADDNAVRFWWSASNTDTPFAVTGRRGVVWVRDLGDATAATWIVGDVESQSVVGCAYARKP